MQTPPKDDSLPIAQLTAIFKETTNSYKHLFFQAILDLIKNGSDRSLALKDLSQKMIELAEFPLQTCLLSFGPQDQVKNILEKHGNPIELVQYVPYRLIAPFFNEKLKGVKDHHKNKLIKELSQKKSDSLYQIFDDSIILNERWFQYFIQHISIIESWALWNWASFIQRRNPNAISIFNKLRKPLKRNSLSKQLSFWRDVLHTQHFQCIYSYQTINPKQFSLDHYLPWSYVGHDLIWNLIPIPKEVNSSKRDSLPSNKRYLNSFCDFHFEGIKISKEIYSPNKWHKVTEDYISGLQTSSFEILSNKPEFTKKLQDLILPHEQMASNMGFARNWVFYK